ncbi:hypothetical protein [Pedobacter frigoris]|uniref:Viral A-type inclusion protein n=1 Tax=Pedobacter frigoris TaxID=2571272 RepID=A0A4U1CHP6_9SPHI|nr:hypothetical protein [Pedobacter frigoris]TKC05951.1 hypothetical protein FA047_11460 [Pedobacter frigoris]
MKKITGILLVVATFIACQQGTDYKVVRDDVMKFHDVVMADHGIIVSNQMKLDTLLRDLKGLKETFPEVDTLKEQRVMNALKSELIKAEEAMNDWMHQFEPDITGKSNEEAVKYFEAEKKKIAGIDSVYKQEIKISNEYLTKFKK